MPTAIIIGDYADLADLLEYRLELLGINVAAKGRNGMGAFKLYGALGPDLVFMDVSMPALCSPDISNIYKALCQT